MATPSTPVVETSSKLPLILALIQAALAGLEAVPATAAGAALASVFLSIFQNATSLYTAETGLPFDVRNIPFEQPVP
jgi:hypothetical protein